jgi:transcriptional regulator with XRE-family HTH domain
MSIGSELKDARESRKITLETVSKRTKIPVKYLEAIEENRYDVFPSHTYVKGFIRAYAKVVGMDPLLLTRQFNAEIQPEEVKIETKNAEAELEKALGWRPTLSRPPVFRKQEPEPDLNLELVDEEYADPGRREPSILRQKALAFRKGNWAKWAGQGLMVLAAVALIGGVVHFGGKLLSKISWGGGSAEKTSETPDVLALVKVQDKYQHLVLKALDKSWVLVTMDDGQSSSEADMDEGEVKTYQAVRNFKLKLGNAGGVDVQFNGRSLGVLGTTGQVIEIQLPPGSAAAAPEETNDNS